VRIVGTNADIAAEILKDAGDDIVSAESLDEAVAKAVELAGSAV
jgi:succinyl-CoA synthetase beta subunit